MIKRKRISEPIKFGEDSNGKASQSRRPTMLSKKSKTQEVKISWSNIESQIAALLYSTKTVRENQEILSIKMDYPGGYLPGDKQIRVEFIIKEGGTVTKF